jgi:MOSC domain-containing protein
MLIGTVKQIWRHPVKSMAGERLDDCTVKSLGIPGDRGWALRDEVLKEITNGKQIPLLMQCAARYREEPTNGAIPPVDITFPDGTTIGSDSPEVNTLLSEVLRKPLTLWPLQPATNKAHYRRAKMGARLAGMMGRFSAFRALLPALSSFGSINRDLREAFSREAHEPIPDISILPPEVLEFTSPLGTYFDAFPIHVLTTASLDAMARFNQHAVWDVRRFRPNFLIETEPGIAGLVESEWAGKTLRIRSVELKCEIPTMRCGMTMQAQHGLPKDPSVLRSIVKDADQNLGIYASVTAIGTVRVGDTVELR